MAGSFISHIPAETLELLQQRTEQRIHGAGEHAAATLSESVADLVGASLPEATFQAMLTARRTAAEDRTRRDRPLGYANDYRSIGLGFTALMTRSSPVDTRRTLDKLHYENLAGSEDQPSVFDVDDTQSSRTIDSIPVFGLRVPKGTFQDLASDRKRLHLVGFSQMEGEVVADRYPDLMVSRYNVLQIIGDAGELWINAHYIHQPDAVEAQPAGAF